MFQIANLKNILSDCKPVTKTCPDAEANLVTCLQTDKDPLACKEHVDALVACANKVLEVLAY